MPNLSLIETPPPPSIRRVVFITGVSGAGMSTALKTLEDLGYAAIDNLPQSIIGALVAHRGGAEKSLAVSIDSRNADFNVQNLLHQCAQLRGKPALHVTLVFLDCDDEALLRRFSETRRRHPLAIDRPVIDGIKRERDLVTPLMEQADQVIDTSLLSIHELRRVLVGNYRLDRTTGLSIFINSFAFRHGVPREADLVFDARFLTNPHWEPELRPLTGRDLEVANYIAHDADYAPFMKHILTLITPLLPRFAQEGKSYLTIAIGCTGGKHRSVLVAEQLAMALATQGYIVGIGHRDIDRSVKETK
ncbi:MAG: RNase adapter RapZ [Hyphomicrobium sp.]